MFWIVGRLWEVVAHESSTVFLNEAAKIGQCFRLITGNKQPHERNRAIYFIG